MKKIYYFLCGVMVCILTGCGQTNFDHFDSSEDLSGIWCFALRTYSIEGNDITSVDWYFDIQEDLLTYYEKNEKTKGLMKDEYLYTDNKGGWKPRMKGSFIFDEQNQAVFFNGYNIATVQRLGKDEAIISSNILKNGKVYRVKGIKDISELQLSGK